MAEEVKYIPNIITAVAALVGVVLGGSITWFKEERRESKRIKTESSYLAILVTAHLERFATGCLHAAYDDGTAYGRPAGRDGEYHIETVQPPEFDPLAMDVDWKVLPADLMHGVLGLPYENEQLASKLDSIWDVSDPPGYTEYFWARQVGFATLGLKVSDLIEKLRIYGNLPATPTAPSEWSRDASLRDVIKRIEAEERAWRARVAAMPPMPSFGDS